MADGVLHRIYPFPLARREWRTEMDSWCHQDVNIRALANDMEDHPYWGARSPALAPLCVSYPVLALRFASLPQTR